MIHNQFSAQLFFLMLSLTTKDLRLQLQDAVFSCKLSYSSYGCCIDFLQEINILCFKLIPVSRTSTSKRGLQRGTVSMKSQQRYSIFNKKNLCKIFRAHQSKLFHFIRRILRTQIQVCKRYIVVCFSVQVCLLSRQLYSKTIIFHKIFSV